MSTNLSEGLAEYAQIRFLNSEECCFELTVGGLLALAIGEEKYKRVSVFCSFPLSLGEQYLSVRDDKSKEIGIIRDMSSWSLDQVNLIRSELERRYFTPIINRVIKMKEEFGYIYWEVETDRGERRFTTKGSHECVLPISAERLIITDVDGNRFDIPDFRSLDAKSVKQLETLM